MTAFQFLTMVAIPVIGTCLLGIGTIFEVARQRARINRIEKQVERLEKIAAVFIVERKRNQ